MERVPASQRGPFTPMRFEATVRDCVVTEGQIPKTLNGGFYRNGPTWRRPTKQGVETAYTIDGMMQGLIFRDGRADFLNRWIQTPKFLAEERAGRSLFEWTDGHFGDWRAWGMGDVIRDDYTRHIPQGTAAISAANLGKDLLALGEQGSPPIAMDPFTLETKGVVEWSSKLSRGLHEPACYGDAAFGPHPKWDPATGELWSCTYRDVRPYISIHCVTVDGQVRTRDIDDGPYNAVCHDMWLTPNYAIVAFTPFVQGRDRIARGTSVYGWETRLPTRIALISRNDLQAPVKWIEAEFEAEYIMHTLAANEIDGKIILDGPIFDAPPFMTEDRFEPGIDYIPFWQVSTSRIGRWVVDLKRGKATSERLGDRPVELPKIDDRFMGQPYRWGFLLGGEPVKSGMRMNTVVRRDVISGKEDSYVVKHDHPVGVYESVFAPRSPDAPEGDGYLITPVAHFTKKWSEFLIFDTQGISDGPIARIELPFHMGWTPHGHWMDFNHL